MTKTILKGNESRLGTSGFVFRVMVSSESYVKRKKRGGRKAKIPINSPSTGSGQALFQRGKLNREGIEEIDVTL
jgi:hypothetical protein